MTDGPLATVGSADVVDTELAHEAGARPEEPP